MTLCVHLTQIGRFLVACGWPAEAHMVIGGHIITTRAADNDRLIILEGATQDERSDVVVPTGALIADHAFMPPEPVAEVVP